MMPESCAERFEKGSVQMSANTKLLEQLNNKVDKLVVAVLGNGAPQLGLEMRVQNLEAVSLARKATKKQLSERVWDIVKGVAILIAGAVIAAVCSGCMNPPGQSVTQTPTSSTDARILVEKIDKLNQQITTLQQTFSTQIANYQLDEARAKVELTAVKTANRRDTIRLCQILGVMLAMVVMMATARSIVPEKYRIFGYLVAMGIAAGSIFIPMIWPF